MRVIIAGGGYAGVMAANRLAGHTNINVTLIEPQDSFVERIRLHEFAAGSRDDVRQSWSDVLHPRVQWLQARMLPLDSQLGSQVGNRHGVTVQIQRIAQRSHDTISVDRPPVETMECDYVVVATGSSCERPAGTFSIGTLEEAQQFRDALVTTRQQVRDVTVRVVGGGLTGVELASELAERNGPDGPVRVALHADQLLPNASRRARKHIDTALEELGVARLGRYDNEHEQLDDELVVWCGGFSPTVAPTVSSTLQSSADPRVFVVGDAGVGAIPDGAPLQMRCASAMPMGAHVANTIIRMCDPDAIPDVGQSTPFNVGYLVTCISLGRNNAVVQFTRGNGSPLPLVASGKVAVTIKEAICASTVRWMMNEAKKPGATSWKLMPKLQSRRVHATQP